MLLEHTSDFFILIIRESLKASFKISDSMQLLHYVRLNSEYVCICKNRLFNPIFKHNWLFSLFSHFQKGLLLSIFLQRYSIFLFGRMINKRAQSKHYYCSTFLFLKIATITRLMSVNNYLTCLLTNSSFCLLLAPPTFYELVAATLLCRCGWLTAEDFQCLQKFQ